jgi:hypothetical protein
VRKNCRLPTVTGVHAPPVEGENATVRENNGQEPMLAETVYGFAPPLALDYSPLLWKRLGIKKPCSQRLSQPSQHRSNGEFPTPP